MTDWSVIVNLNPKMTFHMGVTGVGAPDCAAKLGRFCAVPKSPHIPRMWGIRCAAALPRHLRAQRSNPLSPRARKDGLLRFARNDGEFAGWVERSDTHQGRLRTGDGFRFALPILRRYDFAFSRRVAPEVCMNSSPPRKRREQGMPGACCTRGLVCKMERDAHTSIQVQPEHSGIPCAMV
jgi:hypothetical protein